MIDIELNTAENVVINAVRFINTCHSGYVVSASNCGARGPRIKPHCRQILCVFFSYENTAICMLLWSRASHLLRSHRLSLPHSVGR